MKERYDVVVVGAGPAGSTCARFAAARGASVLVLEKDRDVGMPVRCGEAVSNRSLEKIVDIDPRWIAATIKRFRLISPSGHVVEPDLGGYGYVLERRIFDYDLARLAVEAGAELHTKSYVDGLLPRNPEPGTTTDMSSEEKETSSAAKDRSDDSSGWRGVSLQWKGEPRTVEARIIVGADGVESRVGKWAGIDTTTHMRDMETCAQMTLSNVDLEEDACEFYFGNDTAPMGYLWVFPKGRGMANVGVGISGMASKQKAAIRYLQEFVERRYPGAGVLTTVAGGVPCATTVDTLVKGNIVLVGDAAHQVNPMSGGGITSGMIGGKLAGEAIARALEKNDLSLLNEYPKQWRKEVGAKHDTYYRMKAAVYKFPDETLDDIAVNVLKLREDKRTIWGVFKTALRHQPALVWEMMKTFGLRPSA
ncbi:MAG: NAD(P)/FAD-dependent oxidoreductase [Bacteroidetes bacterium]|nr:NAD(P)/FAD-dependent oxidoreductase [Bacteroidota bacterium]